MTLRGFIERLREEGALRSVAEEVSADREIASVLAAAPTTPVLFQRVAGSSLPVAGNLFATRDRLARAIGLEPRQLTPTLVEAVRNRHSCPLTQSPPCQEKVWMRRDLTPLPILKHLENDGGTYITSSVLIVNDPEFGRNAAFHRLMVIGPNRAAARVVEGRHTDLALKATGGRLEAAVCIGAPPQVLLAAAMSPPRGVDELKVAQALGPTPLARCLTNHLEVPAETEIVLEGRFTGETAEEGPFVDLTGTLDPVRSQPVLEIEAITSRADAVYHALLPGLMEHKMLMGVPREADIYRAVSALCPCCEVRITPGGCSWLHAVVQIEKHNPDDPRRAIEAAFRAHPSLKCCTVVDPDVDPDDPAAVEWALATRFQPHRDLVVMENRPSSSLDPSATHAPGRKSTGSKMGLDATIKGADRAPYRRVRYPALDATRLRELLGE